MRTGGVARPAARRRWRGRLQALAGGIGLLAALSACALPPSASERPKRHSGLPALSIHGHRIQPIEVVYRVGGKARRAEPERLPTPEVSLRDAHRLRMRLVSAYPSRTLQVGTFARADARGVPVDGGDQFDCRRDSACRVQPRAGSVWVTVPLVASVRLVIVRETFDLPDGARLEMVWRFRVADRNAGG